MRILVCGDRNWSDREKIGKRLSAIPRWHTIMHGDCRGADRLAASVADELGFRTIEAYPADWGRHGKKAGPIRNREMLDKCPSLVLAFHRDIGSSRGTKDCVNEAFRRGIFVEVIA